MKKKTAEVIIPEVVTWAPPSKPSWDQAKRYAGEIRGGAEAIVKLGLELVALRMEFLSAGGRPKKNSPHDAASFGNSGESGHLRYIEKGWQAKVREELGISDDTARRWIERALVIIEFKKLQSGQPVEYTPKGKKGKRVLEPTPDVLERVEEALDKIVTGTVPAPRAFAGIVGEGMRCGRQNGIAHKAPTDHKENLKAALAKLCTSLPHYESLDEDDRYELEQIWTKRVWGALPVEWKK